ncbi:MAG: O-antigen ligase family protein [bacterium]
MNNRLAWILIAVAASAFVSLFLSLQAGVFLLFFLIVAWWTWEHPEEGLLFFIILAPLLPMFKITQTIGTVTVVKDVIILILFLKLFLVPLTLKRLPYRRNVLFAPVIALLAWTALEMLRADSIILGILRARDIGLYIMLYFAVLYLPTTSQILQRRMKWFVASLVVVLILGVYQWFWVVDSAVLRFDPAREIWIPRISSVMAHPSMLGQYLVAAAALLAASAVYAINLRQRILPGGLLVVILPFIFLTYSRAVWIGLAAALAALAAVLIARLFISKASKKNLGKYVSIGGAVLVLLLAVMLKFTPAGVFLRSTIDPTYASNEERLEFMARLIAPMTNLEALFGKGLGDVTAQNFRQVDLEAYDLATGSSRAVQLTKNRTLVDNQYLKTFVEMGLTGLLIYGWIYWVFLRTAWKIIKNQGSRMKQLIGLWAVGFLAAFVIQGFFIDTWDIFPTNAMFWIVAGLI